MNIINGWTVDKYFNIKGKNTSLSVSTLRRAIDKGNIKASKKTGKLLFNYRDINKYLTE
tara:strand:- start:714 stop:890 length:177 start_codon:yes stop_codon:yes gene_type:complete